MNPNFFDNLQALSTLFNLTRQTQVHSMPRDPSLLTLSPPQASLTLHQPLQNLYYNMQASASKIENKLNQVNNDELLSRIYYNSLQAEMLKAQMLGLSQQKNLMAQGTMTPLGKVISGEMNTNIGRQQNALGAVNGKGSQEFQVKNMLEFLITKFGAISQSELEQEKQKYSHDEALSQVFNNLVLKYTSMAKTKEEMIKYVFRKALKSIKDKLKGSLKKGDKEVTRAFCQKFFSMSKEEIMRKNGVDIEDEEELLKLMLPFKKTSANKTLNANFFSGIFASEEFCTAYEEYLWGFEREAECDNAQKTKKFVSFIMTCIKSNKISQIMSYKRVPWLKTWVGNTKNIGYQLMCERNSKKNNKMVKLERVESNPENFVETSDSECKVEAGATPESN